jgi:hypothetical protein
VFFYRRKEQAIDIKMRSKGLIRDRESHKKEKVPFVLRKSKRKQKKASTIAINQGGRGEGHMK